MTALKPTPRSTASATPPVYYDTDEELSSALRTGDHRRVSNRMRQTKNEWIIDTFDVQDSYIAVRKGDAPTLRLVNNAIAAMNRDNPSWRTTLFNKYYTGSHTSSKINLTDAEENYVTACNDADTVFTVLVNPDRYPYSYMTPDGMPTGIMVDIFQKGSRPGAAALQIPEARGPQRVQGHAGGRAGGFCH